VKREGEGGREDEGEEARRRKGRGQAAQIFRPK